MASQAMQIDRTESIELSKTISHQIDDGEIAALAFKLWQQRGCPIGSPDEDWFRAEEALKRCETQNI